MYYSYSCPVCGRVFYTFNDHAWTAAQTLFTGVEKHMTDYKEHYKDTQLEHINTPQDDLNTVYHNMQYAPEKPSGGYSLD